MKSVLAVLTLGLTLGPAMAQDAPGAIGVWRTEATDQGYLEVSIASCEADRLCGTILRARDRAGAEVSYPHTGRLMLWDMAAAGPGQWREGQIWDPRNDRVYRSRMEVQGGQLLVSGCVLGLCQSQTWLPVE